MGQSKGPKIKLFMEVIPLIRAEGCIASDVGREVDQGSLSERP